MKIITENTGLSILLTVSIVSVAWAGGSWVKGTDAQLAQHTRRLDKGLERDEKMLGKLEEISDTLLRMERFEKRGK